MSFASIHESGEGQPIIFLHGWTMNGNVFDEQLALLGDRFHCFAPDLPGHGSAVNMDATIAACANYLDQMITDKKLENVVLVGWSMGAAVAWNYLRRFGEAKIGALVSVDMSPKIVNEGDWQLGLVGRTVQTIAASSAHLTADWALSSKAVASGMFATQRGPLRFSADKFSDIIGAQIPDKMHQMWVDLTELDERKTIGQIQVPMLVCFGEKSRAYGAPVAQWIAANAQNARLEEFEMSGHSPHLEEPEAFAKRIAVFIQSL